MLAGISFLSVQYWRCWCWWWALLNNLEELQNHQRLTLQGAWACFGRPPLLKYL